MQHQAQQLQRALLEMIPTKQCQKRSGVRRWLIWHRTAQMKALASSGAMSGELWFCTFCYSLTPEIWMHCVASLPRCVLSLLPRMLMSPGDEPYCVAPHCLPLFALYCAMYMCIPVMMRCCLVQLSETSLRANGMVASQSCHSSCCHIADCTGIMHGYLRLMSMPAGGRLACMSSTWQRPSRT